jgi:ABC-type nitrate/sulfonate/bicarbonate transport system permease component
VPLGVAIGRSRVVAGYLEPLLQFGRALPVVTLAPVFLALFKIGTQMEVATIAFGTIWPILLNTIDGAASVDPVQLETASALPAVPRPAADPADHPVGDAEDLHRLPAFTVPGPDPDGVLRAGR